MATAQLNPIDLQILTLDQDVLPGDTTIRLRGRFEKTSLSSNQYKIGKQYICLSPFLENAELIYVDITADPTLVAGTTNVYEYPITTRGIDTDNTATPPTAYSSTREKTHQGQVSKAAIVVSAAYQQELVNLFSAETNVITKTANGAIAAGKAVYFDSDTTAVQGTDSGAFHGISLTGVADGETVNVAQFIAIGITVPGSTGDDVFSDASGDLTATATGNTYVGYKSGSGDLTIGRRIGTTELSQAQVEDDASTVFGTVSGERLGQAIVANQTVQENVQARTKSVVTRPVYISTGSLKGAVVSTVRAATSGEATSGLSFGRPNNERAYITMVGNGVSGNQVTVRLVKGSSPVDQVTLRIETVDASGEPTGTLVDANATASTSGAALTTSLADVTFTLAGNISITDEQVVAVVLGRSGALDALNYYITGYDYVSGDSSPFCVSYETTSGWGNRGRTVCTGAMFYDKCLISKGSHAFSNHPQIEDFIGCLDSTPTGSSQELESIGIVVSGVANQAASAEIGEAVTIVLASGTISYGVGLGGSDMPIGSGNVGDFTVIPQV